MLRKYPQPNIFLEHFLCKMNTFLFCCFIFSFFLSEIVAHQQKDQPTAPFLPKFVKYSIQSKLESTYAPGYIGTLLEPENLYES